MTNIFHELLQDKKYLLADGAMGTSLFKRGLVSGDEPALWNIDNPAGVQSVHQEFIDAGADIILTNTFGANRFRLKLHKAEHRVDEICAAAVNLVKKAAKNAQRRIIIAGDIGPSGELLEPNGMLTRQECIDGFQEQAMALAQAGADCIWIETMSAIEEVECAFIGASATKLPIIVTMTFDTNGRTMMGITPQKAAQFSLDLHHDHCHLSAMGINCGKSPAESVHSLFCEVEEYNKSLTSDKPLLVAKANCGVPEYRGGEFHFSGTPESMAQYALMAYQLGARIIGGCCGTSGPIIAAMKQALDNYHETTPPNITSEDIIAKLGQIPYLSNNESVPARRQRQRS